MKKYCRKVISVLLSFLMIAVMIPASTLSVSAATSLWTGTVDTTFDGDGTSASPFLITSAAELAGLAANVNSGTTYSGQYIDLTVNINLNSLSWTPIGTASAVFSGTFNGNRYTVSGLYYSGGLTSVGLFGSVSGGAIKNLTVSGELQISASVITVFNCGVGGIAGNATTTSFSSCSSNVTIATAVSSKSGSASVSAGGIIGKATSCTITLCSSNSNISTSNDVVSNKIGGIAGEVALGALINKCSNTGSVTSSSTNLVYAGGIVGYYLPNTTTVGKVTTTEPGYVKNCYNSESIILTDTPNSSSGVGGIIGYTTIQTAFIQDSYTTVIPSYPTGASLKFGVIAGCSSTSVTAATNCYFSGNATLAQPGSTAVTLTMISNGNLCYLLNGGVTSGTQVWRQTLNSMTQPKYAGNTVYFGYRCGNSEAEYTNDNTNLFSVYTAHDYQNGVCTVCGYAHPDDEHIYSDGICTICGYAHPSQSHTYDTDHICSICGYHNTITEHQYNHNHICTICGYANPTTEHTYENGVCTICGYVHGEEEHTYNENHICTICGYTNPTAEHTYGTDHICTICGYTCPTTDHTYDENHICTICGYAYPTAEHNYNSDGTCTICGHLQPMSLVSTGNYTISNVGQLLAFAKEVNDGNDFTDCTITLTSDIIIPSTTTWTPIGYLASATFNGTFDGAGYSVSGLKISAVYDTMGFFGTISSLAVVKNTNLSVNFTNSSATHIGGIAGASSGTIKNCSVKGTVTGLTYAGGIAGICSGTIIDCSSTASVTATTYAGGIVGASAKSEIITANAMSLSNCLGTGTIRAATYSGAIAGTYTESDSILNSYYLVACAKTNSNVTQYGIGAQDSSASTTDIDGVTTSKTSSVLSSGEITYLLNNQRSDGTLQNPISWFQNIGKDSIPMHCGETVYFGYYCSCENGCYSNTMLHESAGESGTYDEDGFCTVCGGGQPLTQLSTTSYGITNAGQLFCLSQQSTYDNNTYEGKTISLLNDITIPQGHTWVPISMNINNPFMGTFDGQKYTVRGLVIDSNQSMITGFSVGLFGNTGSSANIKNVVLDVSFCLAASNSFSYLGGVVGYNSGIINNCFVSGTLDGGYACVGGITGINHKTITCCGSNATLSSNYRVGGMSGFLSTLGYISYSWFSGTSTSGWSYAGGVTVVEDNCTRVTNCYYIEGCATSTYNHCVYSGLAGIYHNGAQMVSAPADSAGTVVSKSASCFSSGELTYLLNGSKSTGTLYWKQDLSSDESPRLTGPIVYFGYTSCAQTVKVYSNNPNSSSTIIPHSFDENGFCTACDSFESITRKSSDSTSPDYLIYEISNAGQLFDFAQKTNDKNYFSGETVKLINDITIPAGKTWVAISSASGASFLGTFDGQGHNISGLCSSSALTYQGLFAKVHSTVKNVSVDINFCTESTSDYNTGGIAGIIYANGIVTNCYSTGTINAGSYVGGICGRNNGIVSNCYSTANVNGTFCVGSVCGNNLGTISNCYYIPGTAVDGKDVTLKVPQNGIGYSSRGNSNTDIAGVTTSKVTEQFRNGEVAYLLQQGCDTQVWGQNLTIDSFPVFSDTAVEYVRKLRNSATSNLICYTNASADLNDDGVVDINDYALCKIMIFDTDAFTDMQLINADINSSSAIDAFDLFYLDMMIFNNCEFV